MNTSLIILLHGVGSSGDDLLPLADAWKHQLPGCDFASPERRRIPILVKAISGSA